MSLMSMLQSPNELGPPAALLQHYNVVKQHTEQSKSRVSCKGCSHTFAGKITRMAAHYMQTAGESVSLCKSPPEGTTDAATAHFSALEKKRVTTKKRKVDNDAIDSKQLSIWKMLDGKGHDSANAAFARMVFAHGLSFVRANLKLLANDYTKRPFIAWDPDSVESDGFLGSGEGEDDPDSEESDFE